MKSLWCIFLFCFSFHIHATKDTSKKEVALVQLSFDGITTYYSGVGTVLVQTQLLIDEMNRDPEQIYHIKSHLITSKCDPNYPYYSPTLLKQNSEICERSGGHLFLLSHPIKGSPFATPADWKIFCQEGAAICADLINQNSFTVIIVHDTPYAQVPLLLKQMAFEGLLHQSFRIIWVPHGTGLLFQDTQTRQDWEYAAMVGALDGGYKIGYTGQYFKNHFQSPPFSMPDSCLVPYHLGIISDAYMEQISEEQIIKELKTRSIPLDKKLIFSLGRAVCWKGHDITLELYRHLKEEHSDLHLVLLTPPTSMPQYFDILKNRIEKEALDVTLIPAFDTQLARFMYQWKNTLIVPLLSRREPLSLTVMEARANPTNAIVLASNQGGLGPQVNDGIDGFICNINGIEEVIFSPEPPSIAMQELIDCANKILLLSDKERAQIVDNGKKLIREDYNLRKNLRCSLLNLFESE